MARLRVPDARIGSRILGIGAYRPHRVVTTAEIATSLGVEADWLDRRTGIRERRYASAGETLQVMAVSAAQKAMASAGVMPDQVDCVLAATMTQLLPMPSLASATAHLLDITGAGSYDISAACAGFCYALAAASDMVRTGSARHVVVIGAERLTDILDPDDRSTAPLFADGAGAVVVGPAEDDRIGPAVWGGDGSKPGAVGMTRPFRPFGKPAGPDAPATGPAIAMVGWQVYRWATEQLAEVALTAIERAGLQVADIDAFVPHQANLRVIEILADKIGLRADAVCARDIVTAGNTSAASVPLALEQLVTGDALGPGATALLMGFGSGLTYAAQVVTLP